MGLLSTAGRGISRSRPRARRSRCVRTVARLGLAGATLAAACGSLSICASPTAWAAATLPPQGVYEECAPANQQQCAGELAQIGGAGFKLALNYTAWYANAAQIQSYASEAQADGLKVIWPLNYSAWRDAGSATSLPSTYTKLAPDCNCNTNSGFVQYAISLVRSLPATWGYYIGDELNPSQEPAVAALAAEVHNLDPAHPLLYIAMGSPNLSNDLQPFESAADYAGADIYPIGSGGSVSDVGPIASTVQQLAQANNRSPAMVLQAFSWSEYQPGSPSWPTETQMQQMRDEALASNPSMILWYSIYDVLRSDDPAGHWRDLTQAAFAPAPTPASGPGASTTGRPTAGSSRKGPRAGIARLTRRRRHHRRHHRRRHHHRARRARHHHHGRRANARFFVPALDPLTLLF